MEHRLTALETRLDTVLPTLATKGDVSEAKAAVSEAKAAIVMWMSGITVAAAAIIITVLVFAFNQVAQSGLSQPQPIVIQVPTNQSTPATNK
jgi:hypothetical protein